MFHAFCFWVGILAGLPRAAPFEAHAIRTIAIVDHGLSTVAKRDALFIDGAWRISKVAFIFLVQGNKGFTVDGVHQFIGGEIVMGAIGEKFCQVILVAQEFARQIESDRRQDTVVALCLRLQKEDREIEGTGGGGDFIEDVSIDISLAITIPTIVMINKERQSATGSVG